jgi:hypothetical protein
MKYHTKNFNGSDCACINCDWSYLYEDLVTQVGHEFIDGINTDNPEEQNLSHNEWHDYKYEVIEIITERYSDILTNCESCDDQDDSEHGYHRYKESRLA